MRWQKQPKKQRQASIPSCNFCDSHNWLRSHNRLHDTMQVSLGEVLWRAEVRVEPPTGDQPQRIAAITLKAETKQHVPQVQPCVVDCKDHG